MAIGYGNLMVGFEAVKGMTFCEVVSYRKLFPQECS